MKLNSLSLPALSMSFISNSAVLAWLQFPCKSEIDEQLCSCLHAYDESPERVFKKSVKVSFVFEKKWGIKSAQRFKTY